jgi:tyrosyl-tRNA synthetase
VLDFLRDVGKHVTVNQMLAKESVKQRIASEQGISFTEFSYMLLQANDFRWLHEHRRCELQLGGSDQWGNITAGIDLIRRTSGAHVHGLTVPLMTKADGTKFGKTADGALWLDAARTSPYELFQYFVNTDDRDVERFLAQLTLLELHEIAVIVAEHRRAPERREAQRVLAHSVTALIHGDTAADDARRASSNFTASSAELTATELDALAREIPTTVMAAASMRESSLSRLLVDVGLASSLSDARRTLAGGGVYVNDVARAEDRPLEALDLLHDRFVVLRKGKRTRHLLVVSDTEHT